MQKGEIKRIASIKALLLKEYKDARCELDYTSLYQLVVAIVLSAQCTDRRVNLVTPGLFARYPSIEELSLASIDELKGLISSINFYNNKAKALISLANSIAKEGMPKSASGFKRLKGVGQKSANAIMIEHFGANLMAVDTHVFRLAHRLGLSDAKDALQTEKDLTKLFKTSLGALHKGMVLHGRYVCKARAPLCHECLLAPFCPSFTL